MEQLPTVNTFNQGNSDKRPYYDLSKFYTKESIDVDLNGGGLSTEIPVIPGSYLDKMCEKMYEESQHFLNIENAYLKLLDLKCDIKIKEIGFIGGIYYYTDEENNTTICLSVFYYPTGTFIEHKIVTKTLDTKYYGSYLGFSYGRAISDLVKEYNRKSLNKIALLFINGNGILHPRGLGLACHVGILTEIPTIGYSSNHQLNPGEYEKYIDAVTQIHKDGKAIGLDFRSRGFLSPGYKTDIQLLLDLEDYDYHKLFKCKQIEPIRIARIETKKRVKILKLEAELRDQIQKNKSKEDLSFNGRVKHFENEFSSFERLPLTRGLYFKVYDENAGKRALEEEQARSKTEWEKHLKKLGIPVVNDELHPDLD